MPTKTLTLDPLLQSNLWREFETAARSNRRRPTDLLAEVIADFLETQAGATIFDDLEKDLRATNYTEDDAVELVKAYRASRRK